MTPTIKRRVAREWLIFLVCIMIGLSARYFWKYFPLSVHGTHLVDVRGEQEAKLLNAQYHRTGVIPEGYQTGSALFVAPESAIENAQSIEELQSVWTDIRNWKYDWRHEEP